MPYIEVIPSLRPIKASDIEAIVKVVSSKRKYNLGRLNLNLRGTPQDREYGLKCLRAMLIKGYTDKKHTRTSSYS